MEVGSEERPVKVLLVAAFPVQYAAPQFVRYTQDPRLDVTVAYCSLRGAEPALDPDFGISVRWDIPLLDGYKWVHPPDWSGPRMRKVIGAFNPSLWTLIGGGNFDVVVCYGYRSPSFWVAALAARLHGAKLAWTTDAVTLDPRQRRDWWKRQLKRLLLPLVYRTGNAVLVPCTKAAGFVASIGTGSAKLFITPLVVDNEFFQRRAAAADREVVRRSWGVPAEAFVALFCGKLVPWKRPIDLVDAIAEAPDVFAVFAGDGELRSELGRRARTLGVNDRVRAIGFVNQTELPATYKAADILVLPSDYEPFGAVVNEAFASGTPAIATTACGAAGDLVRDNETGFTYAYGDVASLAAHLRQLAAEPDLIERLRQGARERIESWGPKENAESFAQGLLSITRGVQ